MYESKKDNALKTLEKKQSKVDEINKVHRPPLLPPPPRQKPRPRPPAQPAPGSSSPALSRPRPRASPPPQLLEDDILPALEKLRKERGEYMKWMAGSDKLERLKRFCLAYEYSRADAARAEAAGGTDALRQQIAQLERDAAELDKELRRVQQEAEEVRAEGEAQSGGVLKKAQEEVRPPGPARKLGREGARRRSAGGGRERRLQRRELPPSHAASLCPPAPTPRWTSSASTSSRRPRRGPTRERRCRRSRRRRSGCSRR